MHLDMDAFFAAVEVLDNTVVAGKRLVVGGYSHEIRPKQHSQGPARK